MARRQKKHARSRDARQRSVKAIPPVMRSEPTEDKTRKDQANVQPGDGQPSQNEHPAGPSAGVVAAETAEGLDPQASERASLAQFDATFFQRDPDYGPQDLDSWLPAAEDDEPPSVPAPPHVLARRSVFRRVVGVVVAAALLVLVTGWGRHVASRSTVQASVSAAVPGAR